MRAEHEWQEGLGRALLMASGKIVHGAEQMECVARLMRSSVEDVSRCEPADRVHERAEAVHAGALRVAALVLELCVASGTLIGIAVARKALDESV